MSVRPAVRENRRLVCRRKDSSITRCHGAIVDGVAVTVLQLPQGVTLGEVDSEGEREATCPNYLLTNYHWPQVFDVHKQRAPKVSGQ